MKFRCGAASTLWDIIMYILSESISSNPHVAHVLVPATCSYNICKTFIIRSQQQQTS